MKLIVNMNLDNSAYRQYAEYPDEGALESMTVASDLHDVANKIALGYREGKIIDINGNTAGSWTIE